jgi:hypothetical protein
MLAQRLHVEIQLYRERARLVVLPPPCPNHIQPIDFSHADQLIHRALTDSRTFLDALGATPSRDARTKPAGRLQPHSDRVRKPVRARSPSHISKSRKPQATRKSR